MKKTKVAQEGILSLFIVLGGDGLGRRPTVVGWRPTMVGRRPTMVGRRPTTATAPIWSHAVVGQRPTTDVLDVLA